MVRDSCVERLFVCTSASSLIMMSSHWCAPPSRSRKTLALWLPSSRSSGPLSEAALLLEICSLLQPAQFFVRKRSSEKSEVLVTVSVLEAKSCGAETVPELVTSPQTTLPVDTPPLVAVKVQSRLSQSSGPADAAPVIVSVAPVSAPVAAKLAAVAAPEAVNVHGLQLGDVRQRGWSTAKMYFTVPPNGVAKLHFGAHFQAPGLPNQTAGTVDV